MSEHIRTPASLARRPTVAVLGAGIAGLTAAHELAERGFVVTVYEAQQDERNGLGSEPAGAYPPVKLGGLAASQYSTVGTHDGSHAELRPFPGRPSRPTDLGRAVAGEHGFRFFPAYYLHIWDLFQRIPVYELRNPGGWAPTARTVYDNVRRVITQGVTIDGKPSLVFPRELPRSGAEFLGILGQLATVGLTFGDVATFQGRMLRYLVTSPLRRARELQNMSAYDFFVGHDRRTGLNQYSYTPRCDALLRQMPKVLVAFDSRWGDARTNISTYLQLYLNMDRRDDKADGVLNGPTTESWFDHWYRHLVALGVRFVRAAATRLDPVPVDPSRPPHLRPRVQITLTDGTRVTPDYIVVAVDAPGAEFLTAPMRAAGTGGTVAGLDGFATSVPPPDGPLQPQSTRPRQRRDPYSMDELGRVPWDRFQTLCGIQYYFDTEFQLLRGHLLYAGTEWALSSINQTGMWERPPILDRDGHVSVLSVDIGDFNAASSHLVDESGRGKAARDCTPDEIATEVWRQIVAALTSSTGPAGEEFMPRPVWYALDRGLIMESGPGQGRGRAVRNATPYLVPIVGDWDNRPSSDPWNPHGTSWSSVPPEDWWLEDLWRRNVWQARHGGYQVHNNAVVFAGTWNKTFTRLTSMEAACESGRHAVNAILDHIHLGPIRRPGPPREDHALMGVPLRLPRPGSVEPDPDAHPGRRLLLCVRYRKPRAGRHPGAAHPRLQILRMVAAAPVGRRRPHVLHPTTRGRSGNVRSHNGLQPAVARLSAGVARAAGAVDGHERRHAVPRRAVHAARRAVHAAVHAARGCAGADATGTGGLHPAAVRLPAGLAAIPRTDGGRILRIGAAADRTTDRATDNATDNATAAAAAALHAIDRRSSLRRRPAGSARHVGRPHAGRQHAGQRDRQGIDPDLAAPAAGFGTQQLRRHPGPAGQPLPAAESGQPRRGPPGGAAAAQ